MCLPWILPAASSPWQAAQCSAKILPPAATESGWLAKGLARARSLAGTLRSHSPSPASAEEFLPAQEAAMRGLSGASSSLPPHCRGELVELVRQQEAEKKSVAVVVEAEIWRQAERGSAGNVPGNDWAEIM